MQQKSLKTIVIVLVLGVFLLSMAPAAYSDGCHCGSDGCRGCGEGDHMGHKIRQVSMPITVSNATGTAATNMTAFTVSSVALRGMKDKVAVITFDNPMTGVYDASADAAYMSTKGINGMTIRVDTTNNSTIPVAGTSGVLSMEKVKVLFKSRDYSIMEFHRFVIHMPNGKSKVYDLEKPVKIIKSKDRKSVVIDANPTFTRAMRSMLSSGNTYPVSAAPLPMTNLTRYRHGDMTDTGSMMAEETAMPT